MRILQIGKYYHPERGGIETNLRSLSVGLLDHATIEVVVAAKSTNSAIDHIDGIAIERLAVLINVLGAPISPKLITRLRQADADVIHVHLPNPWAAVAYLLSGCRIPLIVTYHSDIVRQSFIEPAIRPILTSFLQRASTIICATQDVIDNSTTLLNFRKRCVVIPYGIELRQISAVDLAKVTAISSSHKRPTILAVGRLVSYKGFEYLIRAMVSVDSTLIIIGKGPLKRHLIRLAVANGVESKVTILEDVEDVAPYYHAADIFVLPSVTRNEAFGIVQIEAMAAGKPVINTFLASGVPWVSPHGVSGLTVKPRDSGALARAINQLLGDPELRRKYGNAARSRAFSEFGLELMLSRTLDLYRRLVDTSSASAGESLRQHAATGG